MKKIKITQKRSVIGRPKSQKLTIQALGLRKLNQTVQHNATEQVMGMVQKVAHLIEVEEVK